MKKLSKYMENLGEHRLYKLAVIAHWCIPIGMFAAAIILDNLQHYGFAPKELLETRNQIIGAIPKVTVPMGIVLALIGAYLVIEFRDDSLRPYAINALGLALGILYLSILALQ